MPGITVKIDRAKLMRKEQEFKEKATIMLKNEIARGSEPYVPKVTGRLADSTQGSINTPDSKLIYNTPYAKRQYYEFPHKYTREHPQACMQWFEKWKAANGKAAIQRVKNLAKQYFDGK